MRIKWDCPPTDKELINNFIVFYLDNNQIEKTKVKYSDIISTTFPPPRAWARVTLRSNACFVAEYRTI